MVKTLVGTPDPPDENETVGDLIKDMEPGDFTYIRGMKWTMLSHYQVPLDVQVEDPPQ